jgi:hypothetical protein
MLNLRQKVYAIRHHTLVQFANAACKADGRKEARSQAGFPCFRSGMMMADLHTWGVIPVLRDKF